MKRLLLLVFIMLSVQLSIYAQRPESAYFRKAGSSILKRNQTHVPGKYQQPAVSSQRNENCLLCDTISFVNYSPDPTYISVYGVDSVWVHTYDETDPDPYWSGGYLNFEEGCLNFMHYADNSWGTMTYWDGFTVSKTSANPFPCDIDCFDPCNGLESQFSSITGGGVGGAEDPYAVAYYGYNSFYFPANHCIITLDAADSVCGMYVTNNAYAYKSMKCGDSFTSGAFTTGDSLVLIAHGYNNGFYTGSVDYFLADYRGTSAYIVDEWKWLNLTSLGIVDSIAFEIITSDSGPYGPNTPMYFCMDEIKVGGTASCEECAETDTTQNWFPAESYRMIEKTTTNQYDVRVTPNPASSHITITAPKGAAVEILDVYGNLKYTGVMKTEKESVFVGSYHRGVYQVIITYDGVSQSVKLLKE